MGEQTHTSSTFAAVFAEVSKKIRPFSSANLAPSSVDTARLWVHMDYLSYRWFRSDLLPISMITMFDDPFSRASVNHLVSCVNVSRRVISYTSNAPAAPR